MEENRFDKVEKRLRAEAQRNENLANTTRKIGENVEATRRHDISPDRLNVYLSNERRGLDKDFYGMLSQSYDILNSLAKGGDPLARGILDAVEKYRVAHVERNRQRGTLSQTSYDVDRDVIGVMDGRLGTRIEEEVQNTDVIPKLYERTMTEQEYFDYLNGVKPFAVFETRDYTDIGLQRMLERGHVTINDENYYTKKVELFVESEEGSLVGGIAQGVGEKLDGLIA